MATLTVTQTPSSPRFTKPDAIAPAWQALRVLQEIVNRSSLDPMLLDLVKLRASQINGCAFCIDMHYRDALKRGEQPERLYLLNAWHEVGNYSARERAALSWAEALTRLSDSEGVSDAIHAAAAEHFTESELRELTLAIIAINGWNRLNVAFRVPPAAA